MLSQSRGEELLALQKDFLCYKKSKMLSRILLYPQEIPDDESSNEEGFDCPSPYVVTKIGGRDALPDQHCLVQAALTYVELIHSKKSAFANFTNQVLAQTSKDSKGNPWSTFVYSADHGAKDLRLVDHEEALLYQTQCQELRREIEQKKRDLRAIPMPPGKEIKQSRETRRTDSSKAHHDLKFFVETNPALEDLVRSKCRGLRSSLDTNAVGEILSEVAKQSARLLQELKPLEAFSLRDIAALYPRLSERNEEPMNAVHIVQGVDAFQFGRGKAEFLENSIVQVASQFNFLESTTSEYMAISSYKHDHTQGPRASLGCGAALLQRDSSFKGQDDCEIQPFFGELRRLAPRSIKGGYFMPSKIPDREMGRALEYVKEFCNDLKILPQYGHSVFGPGMVQVFTAAPSFQDHLQAPKIKSPVGQMCNLIAGRQYQAIGRLAAVISRHGDLRVPLHLTLLGMGAFKNPPEVMETAFKMLFAATRGFNVDVYIHAYNDADVTQVQGFLRALKVQASVVTTKDFYKA